MCYYNLTITRVPNKCKRIHLLPSRQWQEKYLHYKKRQMLQRQKIMISKSTSNKLIEIHLTTMVDIFRIQLDNKSIIGDLSKIALVC